MHEIPDLGADLSLGIWWTWRLLDEEIRRPDFGEDWVHTRGSVIQRVFSHDVYHSAELNEALRIAGLPQIDLWD